MRRKPVPCVLCGQETYDSDAVCNECRALYRRGQLAEKIDAASQMRGALHAATVSSYWNFQPFTARRDDSRSLDEVTRDIRTLVLRLMGAVENGRHTYSRGEPPLGGVVGSLSYQEPLFTAPEQAWEDARALVEAIRTLGVRLHAEGKRDGESFVQQLASGAISFDKLIDPSARH